MSIHSREYGRSIGYLSIGRERCFRLIEVTMLVLVALASSVSQAGVNTFTQIGPEGGRINDIAYHPTNSSIVYAATAAGFYRSTNGGQSWVLVSDAFDDEPRAIAVHENAPSRVFVVSPRDGVFRSENDGQSIAQLSSFPVPRPNAYQVKFSADGSVLYVSVDGTLYRSTDLGSTWTAGDALPADPGGHVLINRLIVHPTSAAVVYVTTSGSGAAVAYRSDQSGQSWSAIELPEVEPPSSFNVQDLAISPQTGRLWVAGHAGIWFRDADDAAWTDTDSPDGGSTRLWIDPRTPERVYGSGIDGLLVLPAVGQPWSNIHNGAKTARPNTLVAHPNDANHMLLGGPEGLARSLNGGATWTSSHAGIHALEVFNLEPVPSLARIYMSSVSNGVHSIDTDNLTTVAVNNESLRGQGPFGSVAVNARPVHTIPSEPNRLIIGLGSNLARSSDGGQTWQLLHTNMFTYVRSIASSSAQGVERILVLDQQGLFGSTNRGDTWEAIELPGIDRIGELMTVAPSNRAVVLVTASTDPYEPFVLKSEDGGATWRRLHGISALGIHSIAIDARDDRTMYIMADHHLWKSTDGGDSWSDIGVPAISALTLDPHSSQIMYGGYPPNIRRSVDGGSTWQAMQVDGVTLRSSAPILAVDPARSHRLFVTYGSHSVKVISIEPDLALSSSQVPQQITNGEAVSVTYTVSNEGPFDATEVVTTIELEESATEISATAAEGSCALSGATVTCTMPILRTDDSRTILVTTRPAEIGTFAVSASVRGTQPDSATGNNSTQSSIDVVQASAPTPPPSGGGETPTPPAPPPSGGGSSSPTPSSGSGGGGGSSSALFIVFLVSLAAARRMRR